MHVMCIDLCDCTSTGQTGDKHHCVNVPQRYATVHKHKVKLGLIQIKMSCQAQRVRIYLFTAYVFWMESQCCCCCCWLMLSTALIKRAHL